MHDTICAISTPIGEAGIGIVRISGGESLKIAKRIFRSKNKLTSHRLIYGKIIDPDSNCIIDEALLCYMKAPKTYTREDVVEINLHSGFAVLSEVLSLVLKEGARLAEPGEFTKRAFLKGRIDLVQAEAVEKIISSKTTLAREISTQQLQGELSLKIRKIRENLLSILSLIEASLDFEEELDRERLFKDIFSIKKELKGFLEGYRTGKFLSNSCIGVIIGRPNVGKSSILNALIGTDRAIVTPIPGTTRDLVSEVINIKGIPLKITDTAGLCDAIDLIEKEGIKRAYKAIENADIVIYVLDGTGIITKDDIAIFEKIKNKSIIFTVNKSDLPKRIDIEVLKKYKKPIVFVSAKRKEVSLLLDEIEKALFSSYDEAHIITSIRHKEAMERSLEHLDRAISSKEDEVVSIELRDSIDAISEILGENITNEDILDRIFSTFCVGK
ncbi:MAG: tRNA uridine-5-carboxymethylaminomethyl(34) synthesis GTPase MnmE [bacterium]